MNCNNCGKEHNNPLYCSRGCSVSFNNRKNPKRKRSGRYDCINCGSIISSNNKAKYCSNKCQHDYQYELSISSWDLKKIGNKRIKRYLVDMFGNKCSVCGIESWNNKPIVFDLDHIDGNSDNNSKENVRLICPNCHSQTETYKGRNKGNGRFKRAERYRQGKSF